MILQVRSLAKAFIHLGLKKSHSVCIIGFNAPEWHISCLATVVAGGLTTGTWEGVLSIWDIVFGIGDGVLVLGFTAPEWHIYHAWPPCKVQMLTYIDMGLINLFASTHGQANRNSQFTYKWTKLKYFNLYNHDSQ